MVYRSHRGGVYYTPENTMPAFRDALKEGFEYIETDPSYTKDGFIVLHHDGTLNRTCRNPDGTEIEGSVYLHDLNYDELDKYDAGIHCGAEFKGEKIPLLEELLALAENTGTIIALDKKIPTENMTPLFDIVAKYNTKVCFSCKDTERIEKILKRFPDAMIDYDGIATREMLAEVTSLVKYENLNVWMYMDRPNFNWLDDRRKASKEKCAVVKEYARLGIGNINNPYDMREALSFEPDIIEV